MRQSSSPDAVSTTDGRGNAVRDGFHAVQIVDPSGVDAPITVPVSSLPFVADLTPDSRQLVIADDKEVVVAITARPDNARPALTHDGRVMAAEFRPAS
jgi:hypothetical protein